MTTPAPLKTVPHAAKLARLRYVSCSEQGIRRVSRGKGFAYVLPNGSALRDARQLERIRKLALPPAWKNVWICLDPRGHLQATGYDLRGRKQYRYDARWRSARDAAKYQDLLGFAERLPRLRRRLARDLRSPGLSRDKVLATIVSVMERTGCRVGNERYVAENGSYGLTTLLDRHARVGGASIEFSFRGKGGKPYRASIRDRQLAALVKRCRDIPGQRLFQYVDERGRYQSVSSSDVNGYLKRATGADVSAKTFRTWTATLLAACELRDLERATSVSAFKRQVNAMLGTVAGELGNTPAICRKSYVDPRVLLAFEQGSLAARMGRGTRRAGLSARESALVSLLDSGGAERRAA